MIFTDTQTGRRRIERKNEMSNENKETIADIVAEIRIFRAVAAYKKSEVK